MVAAAAELRVRGRKRCSSGYDCELAASRAPRWRAFTGCLPRSAIHAISRRRCIRSRRQCGIKDPLQPMADVRIRRALRVRRGARRRICVDAHLRVRRRRPIAARASGLVRGSKPSGVGADFFNQRHAGTMGFAGAWHPGLCGGDRPFCRCHNPDCHQLLRASAHNLPLIPPRRRLNFNRGSQGTLQAPFR